MASITATDISGTGTKTVTVTTLDGSSDTFVYNESKLPQLIMHNPTGSPISPVIDGDGATTVTVPGVGSVSVSGGYSVGSIAASATVYINLYDIRKYLSGTIDITSGTGLECQLLEK